MTVTVADMELKELLADSPTSGAIASLRERAGELLAVMQPRLTLRDGSRGYHARAETTITIRPSIDGQSAATETETIVLRCADSEIRVLDPVLTLDGTLRIDLEVLSYVATGHSEMLDAPVTFNVGQWADPALAPTYGRLEIPLGTDFGSTPVRSTQQVYFSAETPLGKLTSDGPVVMHAMVTKLPPVGIPYVQEGEVPLLDERGVIRAVKVATTSMLTEYLP